jgi:uncharacterized membrane protein
MAGTTQMPRRKLPLLVRALIARPRLRHSLLVGLVGTIVMLMSFRLAGWLEDDLRLRWITCGLLGWDLAVGLYLGLTIRMFRHADTAHIRRESATQDEGSFAILLLTVAAGAVSVGSIFFWLEFATRAEALAGAGLLFLIVTLLLSWGFIHTMFALHYAHEYYAKHRKSDGGLIFPRDQEPNYWDFVYFAFGIGTATQVSDVEVTSKAIRWTVTVHGIVAFFFNVTVLALAVGLAGDALQNGGTQ